MKPLLFLFLCLLLANCTVSTPQTRIDQHPALYQGLSPEHQTLVQRGQITEKMPSAGVFLAWGKPASKRSGYDGGKDYQQWDYNSLRPVVSSGFSYGYGYGPYYGHRGRYGRYGYYDTFGLSQSVDYIPYRSRSVVFRNDRVASWEISDPPF